MGDHVGIAQYNCWLSNLEIMWVESMYLAYSPVLQEFFFGFPGIPTV